jgi:hypothetical protein
MRLTRKQRRTAKKLSADRPLKFATYAKDIQKPGVFLKLLGFNLKVLLRNPVFAERQELGTADCTNSLGSYSVMD